jgi:ribosomal protein S12 methylthiotransferase accessory factor
MEIKISFEGNKGVNALYNKRVIKTDQSVQSGGNGAAPEPFSLFLASIGTCTGIYVKSFCDQRGIPAEGIRLIQRWSYDRNKRLIDQMEIDILLPADFPEKYKDAVVKAANLCTVKRHLLDPPEIRIKTVTV